MKSDVRALFKTLLFFISIGLTLSCPIPSALHDFGCTSQVYSNKSCIYLCPKNTYYDGQDLCKTSGLQVVSIHNEGQNDLIKAILDDNSIDSAFIGYIYNSSQWIWDDQSSTNFNNLANVAIPTKPAVATTRDPTKLRRGVSVSIMMDASVYSTPSNTLDTLEFAKKLATHISAQGNAECALFYYGCNTHNLPSFSPLNLFLTMVSSIADTLLDTCIRTQPYPFAQALDDLMWYYYGRSSERVKKYNFEAAIILSSNSDSNAINAAPPIFQLNNATVVSISVGNKAASLQRYAIPSSNNIRIVDFSNIDYLVHQVDQMIFSGAAQQQSFQEEEEKLSMITDNVESCSYFNAADEMWYPGSCLDVRSIICTGPEKQEAIENPTVPSVNLCVGEAGEFHSFRDLDNAKCYRVDTNQKSYNDSKTECQNEVISRKEAKLTSISSAAEMAKISSLVSNSTCTDCGMFWIGLNRDSDTSPWTWVDGEPFNSSTSYSNWRKGYPRDADGANCVAYVLNDDKWINTDCDKLLQPVCAYPLN